ISLGHAMSLSKIIVSFKLTSLKGSDPHSLNNPYLFGFPKISYSNHKPLLLIQGYTIICIDELPTINQKSKASDLEERTVGEICTLSTNMDLGMTSKKSDGLVCLYFNYQNGRNLEKFLITSGISYIDNASGDNLVHEVYSAEHDEKYALYE